MTTSQTDYVATLKAELARRLAHDGQVTRAPEPERAARDLRVESLDFDAHTIARLYYKEDITEHRRHSATGREQAHAALLQELAPRAQMDWLGVHLGQTTSDRDVFNPVAQDYGETCATCAGHGRNKCSGCGGTGECTCSACSSGRVNCSSCSGGGKRRCDTCSGAGNTRRRVHVRNNFKADGGWDEVWEDQNVTCNGCYGSGYAGNCFNCTGTGKTTCHNCNGRARISCPTCNGAGRLDCAPCHASGERYFTLRMTPHVHETRTLTCEADPDGFKEFQELAGYLDQPDAQNRQDLTWHQSGAKGEYRYRAQAHAASAWLDDQAVIGLGHHARPHWINNAYQELLLLPVAEDIGTRSYARLDGYPLGQEVLTIVQGSQQPQTLLATYDPKGFLNDGIARLKAEMTIELTRGERWPVAVLLLSTFLATLFSLSQPVWSYVSALGVTKDATWLALVAWIPWVVWIGLAMLRRTLRQRRSLRLLGKSVRTASRIGVVSAMLLVVVQAAGFGLQQTATVSAEARYICGDRFDDPLICTVQSAAIHFFLAPYSLWEGQDIPLENGVHNWQAR